MNKVLIISYLFTPSKEIGSRRWSKIARALVEKDWDVEVLTSTYSNLEDGITRHYFKPLYPSVLLKHSLTFLDKVLYKASLLFLNLFKGTPYDRSILSGKGIAKKTRKLIENKSYDYVIVSVAPFNMAYELSKMIKEYPKTKFIVDFRDPWTWDSNYGMNIISKKKREFEFYKEKEVIKEFHLITAPSKSMVDYIEKTHSITPELLPHFYGLKRENKQNLNRLKGIVNLIYGGTIYEDSLKDLMHFNKLMLGTKGEVLVQYSIYSGGAQWDNITEENNYNLNFFKQVEENILFDKIEGSDYYVAFYPERYKNFISSKIYEIIALRTPIILISEEGELSKFIVNNRLGKFYKVEDINLLVSDLKHNTLNIDYDYSYPIEQFEIRNVVKNFIKCSL